MCLGHFTNHMLCTFLLQSEADLSSNVATLAAPPTSGHVIFCFRRETLAAPTSGHVMFMFTSHDL
jgi:hypothetical protein